MPFVCLLCLYDYIFAFSYSVLKAILLLRKCCQRKRNQIFSFKFYTYDYTHTHYTFGEVSIISIFLVYSLFHLQNMLLYLEVHRSISLWFPFWPGPIVQGHLCKRKNQQLMKKASGRWCSIVNNLHSNPPFGILLFWI